MTPRGRVLIVAGSDSGGGAGIQADLKTVTVLGAFGATAITALTAQNTLGVTRISAVDPDFIAEQIRVVLTDIGADAIKTGMLHSPAVIEAVLGTIDAISREIPIVVDPVMVAKGGATLLQQEAIASVRARLVPRARLVTPNLPEAEVILGRSIRSTEDMRRAARDLVGMGAAAALVKGGHLDGPRVIDVLFDRDAGERLFEGDRIASRSTHGTGCTLASAIAAGVAQGMPVPDAVDRARRFVRAAIATAPGLGQGHGPLNHAAWISAEDQKG